MSAQAEALPRWWSEACLQATTHRTPPELISTGVERFDAEAAAARLCETGFAVVDNFLGRPAAVAVREAIRELDANGALRLGRLQHGTQQTTNNDTRSDRITFLPSVQSSPNAKGVVQVAEGGALRTFIEAVDGMRARLSSRPRLIERLGGTLDDCNFMCAIYPGGGAHYVKHRDALPYKAGRKLTV